MEGKKITDLSIALTPYSGGEEIPLQQENVTRAAPLSSFIEYFSDKLVADNADTAVRALTSNWQSTYTNVSNNSAYWDISGFTTLTDNVSGSSLIPVIQNNTRYVTTFNNLINLPFVNINGSTYTLSLSDLNYYVRKTHSGNQTVLVPSSFDFIDGMVFTIRNAGTGTLTLTSQNIEVTLNFNQTLSGNVIDSNTTAQLYCLGSNTWDII